MADDTAKLNAAIEALKIGNMGAGISQLMMLGNLLLEDQDLLNPELKNASDEVKTQAKLVQELAKEAGITEYRRGTDGKIVIKFRDEAARKAFEEELQKAQFDQTKTWEDARAMTYIAQGNAHEAALLEEHKKIREACDENGKKQLAENPILGKTEDLAVLIKGGDNLKAPFWNVDVADNTVITFEYNPGIVAAEATTRLAAARLLSPEKALEDAVKSAHDENSTLTTPDQRAAYTATATGLLATLQPLMGKYSEIAGVLNQLPVPEKYKGLLNIAAFVVAMSEHANDKKKEQVKLANDAITEACQKQGDIIIPDNGLVLTPAPQVAGDQTSPDDHKKAWLNDTVAGLKAQGLKAGGLLNRNPDYTVNDDSTVTLHKTEAAQSLVNGLGINLVVQTPQPKPQPTLTPTPTPGATSNGVVQIGQTPPSVPPLPTNTPTGTVTPTPQPDVLEKAVLNTTLTAWRTALSSGLKIASEQFEAGNDDAKKVVVAAALKDVVHTYDLIAASAEKVLGQTQAEALGAAKMELGILLKGAGINAQLLEALEKGLTEYHDAKIAPSIGTAVQTQVIIKAPAPILEQQEDVSKTLAEKLKAIKDTHNDVGTAIETALLPLAANLSSTDVLDLEKVLLAIASVGNLEDLTKIQTAINKAISELGDSESNFKTALTDIQKHVKAALDVANQRGIEQKNIATAKANNASLIALEAVLLTGDGVEGQIKTVLNKLLEENNVVGINDNSTINSTTLLDALTKANIDPRKAVDFIIAKNGTSTNQTLLSTEFIDSLKGALIALDRKAQEPALRGLNNLIDIIDFHVATKDAKGTKQPVAYVEDNKGKLILDNNRGGLAEALNIIIGDLHRNSSFRFPLDAVESDNKYRHPVATAIATAYVLDAKGQLSKEESNAFKDFVVQFNLDIPPIEALPKVIQEALQYQGQTRTKVHGFNISAAGMANTVVESFLPDMKGCNIQISRGTLGRRITFEFTPESLDTPIADQNALKKIFQAKGVTEKSWDKAVISGPDRKTGKVTVELPYDSLRDMHATAKGYQRNAIGDVARSTAVVFEGVARGVVTAGGVALAGVAVATGAAPIAAAVGVLAATAIPNIASRADRTHKHDNTDIVATGTGKRDSEDLRTLLTVIREYIGSETNDIKGLRQTLETQINNIVDKLEKGGIFSDIAKSQGRVRGALPLDMLTGIAMEVLATDEGRSENASPEIKAMRAALDGLIYRHDGQFQPVAFDKLPKALTERLEAGQEHGHTQKGLRPVERIAANNIKNALGSEFDGFDLEFKLTKGNFSSREQGREITVTLEPHSDFAKKALQDFIAKRNVDPALPFPKSIGNMLGGVGKLDLTKEGKIVFTLNGKQLLDCPGKIKEQQKKEATTPDTTTLSLAAKESMLLADQLIAASSGEANRQAQVDNVRAIQ